MCGELPLNSLRSFVSTLVLVVVYSSWFKIEEFLPKMAIGLTHWRVEQKNYSFLINWPAWAFCSEHLFRLTAVLSVHLCISVSLPRLLSFLGFNAPLGRPSASLEFLQSLVPPHYACCISLPVLTKTQLQMAFSLHAGALSVSHSPPQ